MRERLSKSILPRQKYLEGLPLAQLTSATAITRTLAQEAKRKKLSQNIRFKFSSYPQLAKAIGSDQVAGVMPAIAAAGMPQDTVRMVALPLLEKLTREVYLAWSLPMAEVRPGIPRVAKLLASAGRLQKTYPAQVTRQIQ